MSEEIKDESNIDNDQIETIEIDTILKKYDVKSSENELSKDDWNIVGQGDMDNKPVERATYLDIDKYWNFKGYVNPKIDVEFLTGINKIKNSTSIEEIWTNINKTNKGNNVNNYIVSANITDKGVKELELVLYDRTFTSVQKLINLAIEVANTAMMSKKDMEEEAKKHSFNANVEDGLDLKFFTSPNELSSNLRISFGYNENPNTIVPSTYTGINDTVRLKDENKNKEFDRWKITRTDKRILPPKSIKTNMNLRSDNVFMNQQQQSTLYTEWEYFFITGLSTTLTDTGIKYNIKAVSSETFALNGYKMFQQYSKLVGKPKTILATLMNMFNNDEKSPIKVVWIDDKIRAESSTINGEELIMDYESGKFIKVDEKEIDNIKYKVDKPIKELNKYINMVQDIKACFTNIPNNSLSYYSGEDVEYNSNIRQIENKNYTYEKYCDLKSYMDLAAWPFEIRNDKKLNYISSEGGYKNNIVKMAIYQKILSESYRDLIDNLNNKDSSGDNRTKAYIKNIVKVWLANIAIDAYGIEDRGTLTEFSESISNFKASNDELEKTLSEIDKYFYENTEKFLPTITYVTTDKETIMQTADEYSTSNAKDYVPKCYVPGYYKNNIGIISDNNNYVKIYSNELIEYKVLSELTYDDIVNSWLYGYSSEGRLPKKIKEIYELSKTQNLNMNNFVNNIAKLNFSHSKVFGSNGTKEGRYHYINDNWVKVKESFINLNDIRKELKKELIKGNEDSLTIGDVIDLNSNDFRDDGYIVEGVANTYEYFSKLKENFINLGNKIDNYIVEDFTLYNSEGKKIDLFSENNNLYNLNINLENATYKYDKNKEIVIITDSNNNYLSSNKISNDPGEEITMYIIKTILSFCLDSLNDSDTLFGEECNLKKVKIENAEKSKVKNEYISCLNNITNSLNSKKAKYKSFEVLASECRSADNEKKEKNVLNEKYIKDIIENELENISKKNTNNREMVYFLTSEMSGESFKSNKEKIDSINSKRDNDIKEISEDQTITEIQKNKKIKEINRKADAEIKNISNTKKGDYGSEQFGIYKDSLNTLLKTEKLKNINWSNNLLTDAFKLIENIDYASSEDISVFLECIDNKVEELNKKLTKLEDKKTVLDESNVGKEIELSLGSQESRNPDLKLTKTLSSLFNDFCSQCQPKVRQDEIDIKNDGSPLIIKDESGEEKRVDVYEDLPKYNLTWGVVGHYKNKDSIPIVGFYYKEPKKPNMIRKYSWGTGNPKAHCIKALSIASNNEFAILHNFNTMTKKGDAISVTYKSKKGRMEIGNYMPDDVPCFFTESFDNKRDEIMFNNILNNVYRGTITVLGDPSLRFGGKFQPYTYPIYIDIKLQQENNSWGIQDEGIKSTLSGYYMITQISHNITSSGYTTTMEVMRYPGSDDNIKNILN